MFSVRCYKVVAADLLELSKAIRPIYHTASVKASCLQLLESKM